MPPTTRKDKGTASRPCSDREDTEDSDEEFTVLDSGHQTLQIDYKGLASEVTEQIMSDKQETLTTTILASLHFLQEEVTKHDNRLNETEQRLSLIEDDVASTHSQVKTLLSENPLYGLEIR